MELYKSITLNRFKFLSLTKNVKNTSYDADYFLILINIYYTNFKKSNISYTINNIYHQIKFIFNIEF